MTRPDDYLKTQTVAEGLGVSVSTIKRWVDSGTIRAIRTAGKHRLIPRSEAVRVASEMGIDPRRLLEIRGSAAARVDAIDEASRDRLYELLRGGQARQAKLLIHAIYLSGHGAALLADQLIRPVMARIGHGWMVGALDVYQEHQASQIVASAVTELIERVAKEQVVSGPLALGAVTEGDPYLLSCLLGELVLRELGWEVRNLGVNLPLRSLANAVLEYRPAMVFLSVNFVRDPDRFLREYGLFYETCSAVNAAVIVGGQALDDALRSRLVYTAFGDRMVHLSEFARRLHSGSEAARTESASDPPGPSVLGMPQIGGP